MARRILRRRAAPDTPLTGDLRGAAGRAAAARGEAPPLPTAADLRAFLGERPGRVSKSEIARHFGLSPEQRPALRDLVASLRAEGAADGARSLRGPRRPRAPDTLPETAALEVFGTDPDGEPLARPIAWDGEGRPPLVHMRPERPGRPALAPGDRILARVTRIGPGRYEGRSFKRIGSTPSRVLGVHRAGRIEPVDRRVRSGWVVPAGESGGAAEDELVLAEPLAGREGGAPRARVVERLGPSEGAGAVSRLLIAAHGIPHEMPEAAESEAARARAVPLGEREDLRAVPLVTIDGEDARDFDDAVHAEPDGEGGHRLLVAIADVAHYVRPGSALDEEAARRGNSVYFPDRVVPMLPEPLSNGWCSLRPDEDRACLFVEVRLDAEGRKLAHRFGRGLMRSAARLTYEALQAARDAGRDPEGAPPGLIGRLYPAFRLLLAARQRRGTLDLDLPERRVVLDGAGRVLSVLPRPRLDSHRLIEEFMVLANVCAAEELERLRQPCVYRVHDRPSDEKMEGLRAFLGPLGVSLPASNQVKPRDFARVLERFRDAPESRLVSETLLRGQSQAAYGPENIGHFGLALPRYAHFTSPIRRYADLLVHRAMIRGLRLGPDGLTAEQEARLAETCEAIGRAERRAALAERDAVDRYLAAHMADRVGAHFAARVSGVTRAGLFVTLEENGASGIIPLSALPDDRWFHEDAAMRLTGRRTGLSFALGQEVEVRLSEAVPRTGSLAFQLLPPSAPRRGGSIAPSPKASKRGRRPGAAPRTRR